MKFEMGRCLLQERLNESDMTLEELSRQTFVINLNAF